MDNLLGGDWGEIQNTKYALEIKLVFGCFYVLISPTQKFKLEKSTLNTKEGGKSRFEEILEL